MAAMLFAASLLVEDGRIVMFARLVEEKGFTAGGGSPTSSGRVLSGTWGTGLPTMTPTEDWPKRPPHE